jgi:hypothetical protein
MREKTLWRMLYETAARSSEILALDVEQLDLANRRAPVRSKGSQTEWVHWGTGTAHLLPRLLRLPDGTSRTSGPLLLAARKSVPARRPAPRDICPHARAPGARSRRSAPRCRSGVRADHRLRRRRRRGLQALRLTAAINAICASSLNDAGEGGLIGRTCIDSIEELAYERTGGIVADHLGRIWNSTSELPDYGLSSREDAGRVGIHSRNPREVGGKPPHLLVQH